MNEEVIKELLKQKPRFYMADLNNYTDEFLIRILEWQHQMIEAYAEKSTKGVTIERVGNITKHGTEAIRAVAGTDKEYESYVDKYSTKNEVNSQELPKVNPSSVTKSDFSSHQLGDSVSSANDTKTPDTHSQIKKEIDKDYDKSLDIPYPRGHNWEGLTPRQVNQAYAKTNESVGEKHGN